MRWFTQFESDIYSHETLYAGLSAILSCLLLFYSSIDQAHSTVMQSQCKAEESGPQLRVYRLMSQNSTSESAQLMFDRVWGISCGIGMWRCQVTVMSLCCRSHWGRVRSIGIVLSLSAPWGQMPRWTLNISCANITMSVTCLSLSPILRSHWDVDIR